MIRGALGEPMIAWCVEQRCRVGDLRGVAITISAGPRAGNANHLLHNPNQVDVHLNAVLTNVQFVAPVAGNSGAIIGATYPLLPSL